LKPIKEIRAQDGTLHFRRWRVLSTPWFNLYVHAIYRSDEDMHMHDHPWDFISVILKGGYIENVLHSTRAFKPGDINVHKAEDVHKLTLLTSPTWTFVLTGRSRRVWGYLVGNDWVDSNTYRDHKRSGRY